jgi:hypothetical protein
MWPANHGVVTVGLCPFQITCRCMAIVTLQIPEHMLASQEHGYVISPRPPLSTPACRARSQIRAGSSIVASRQTIRQIHCFLFGAEQSK